MRTAGGKRHNVIHLWRVGLNRPAKAAWRRDAAYLTHPSISYEHLDWVD
jgi:hypothetical protein